jgi:hypothetical protein
MPSGLCGILGGGGGGSAVASGLMGEVAVAGDVGAGMRLPGRGRQCLSGAGRGALGLVAVAVGFGF